MVTAVVGIRTEATRRFPLLPLLVVVLVTKAALVLLVVQVGVVSRLVAMLLRAARVLPVKVLMEVQVPGLTRSLPVVVVVLARLAARRAAETVLSQTLRAL